MEYKAEFYVTPDGNCPVEVFLDSLPEKSAAKISRWIVQLEELGPHLPRPYADIVRGKIRELRVINFQNQYRLLYFFDAKRIILTHGFAKKTDEIEESEISKAERIFNEYFAGKDARGS